ncbi:hypothetical protein D3C87_2159870 [compost metagenome]
MPRERILTSWLVTDFFGETTRFPPHTVQRIPRMVFFTIILSRSISAIALPKVTMADYLVKKKG